MKSSATSIYPEVVAAIVTILLTAAFAQTTLSPDVAWQIWIAHHLRMGARLYVDILEVNPPLWFWMGVPVDWLAERLGVLPEPLMVIATGFASLSSVAATGRLLVYIPAERRGVLLVYAALILMFMPLSDMGQREQLVAIGALPYIALIARRVQARNSEDREISVFLALAVGTGAALGFALKHYFLLVPLALEGWLLFEQGRAWRPLRPETVGVVMVGLLYAAAMALYSRDYFTTMLPLVDLAYGAMQARDWSAMFQPPQWIWLAILPLALSRPRLLGRAAPFTTALLIASLSFAASWLIQFKGWPYHAIPTSACVALALAALLAERWPSVSAIVRVTAPTILILPLAYAIHLGPYRNVLAPQTRPLLTGLMRGDSVAFVTTQAAYSWPLMNERGFRYPSRYYTFWMLQRGAPDALKSRIAAETARDFRCIPPRRLIFDGDMWQVFSRNPDFADLLTHYRPIRKAGNLEVFEMATPLLPLLAAGCRRGV
jgi:hypothetical protein